MTRFRYKGDVQLIDMTLLSGAGDAVTPPLTLRRWGMVGDEHVSSAICGMSRYGAEMRDGRGSQVSGMRGWDLVHGEP